MSGVLQGRYEPPEHRTEFEDLDSSMNSSKAVAFVMTIRGDEFARTFPYAVIVEMWDKTKYGRVRREWQKQFSEAARKLISTWHTKFRKWHLQTGMPERVAIRPTTMELLRKALNFFATV